MGQLVESVTCQICGTRPPRHSGLMVCGVCLDLDDPRGFPLWMLEQLPKKEPTPKRDRSPKPPKKICSTCHKRKPRTVEYYSVDLRTFDGFAGQCRDCKRQTRKKWEDANRPRNSGTYASTGGVRVSVCMVCNRPLKPWEKDVCGNFTCHAVYGRTIVKIQTNKARKVTLNPRSVT